MTKLLEFWLVPTMKVYRTLLHSFGFGMLCLLGGCAGDDYDLYQQPSPSKSDVANVTAIVENPGRIAEFTAVDGEAIDPRTDQIMVQAGPHSFTIIDPERRSWTDTVGAHIDHYGVIDFEAMSGGLYEIRMTYPEFKLGGEYAAPYRENIWVVDKKTGKVVAGLEPD